MSLLESIPDHYRPLLERPVGIFGAGASGQAAAQLLHKIGVRCSVYDERTGEEGSVSYAFTQKEAAQHGLVIHSPAFRHDHPWLSIAEAAGCRVVSEIDFAQQFRSGPTLVVTGTNGKTTLQEFITFSLKRSGISAVGAGQNQYPLSRLAVRPELDGVTAVCEIGLPYAAPLKEFRFDAIFWTNFHEDHVDGDVSRKGLFEQLLRLSNLSPEAGLYFGDSVFEAAAAFGLEMPERAKPLAPGEYPGWDLPDRSAFATNIHRQALALFRRYWLDKGYSDSLLKSAAESFEVRAHRLHLLSVIGKTQFWNDSNAGNFAATEAALANFKQPVVWIGGGHYRGGDLDAFVGSMKASLRGAVVTGDVRERLLPVLREKGIPCTEAVDLKRAVESAFNMAKGEVPVVFSPGFIAGEEYGDFIERGICYENAVLGLKHQKGSV
jgi:UDP-N-acetylmuramoylalanine--D-glutamate ligase